MREYLAGLAALVCSGCYQPDTSADYVGPPRPPALHDASVPDAPRDAGHATDAGHDAPDAATPLTGSLRIRVLTAPVGGRYAPKNIGAIWIERPDGTFVRTLALWAGIRKRYLSRFQTASRGDVADAITTATLTAHERHEVTWDLRDATRQPVSPGDYVVRFEVTDRDAFGADHSIPFTLGEAPVALTPANTAQFQNLSIALE